MRFEIEYPVDAAMQDASMRQGLLSIHVAPKLPAFGFICVLAVYVAFTGAGLHPIVRWLLPVACVVIVLMWLRAYLDLRAMGRKRLSLSSNPLAHLGFDEKAITTRTANETKTYEWERLERVVESRDFLFLMSGKASVFCIPKSVISREAGRYIRERMTRRAS